MSGPQSEQPPDRTPAPLSDRAFIARRTFVVLLVAAGFGLGLLFIFQIRQVIAWMLVATLLAIAMDPAVSWLMRHGWRRGLAAFVVFLVFLLLIAAVIAALASPLITQGRELVDNLPDKIRGLFEQGSVFEPLNRRFNITDRLSSLSFESVWKVVSGGGATVLQTVGKGVSLVFATVTTLTLTIMLLIEGPRVWRGFLGLYPPERRPWVDRLGKRMGSAVGGYVRGNLFTSAIAATFAYIVLLILDVPYPLPLALVVGLLDIIPLVGATIGAIICVLVALTQGWLPAVIIIGYFVVYQQVENNFLQPVVYSRTVQLTPLTVLLASLIGAVIAGILGVLAAIPLASALFIFAQEWQNRRANPPAPDEDTGETPGARDDAAGESLPNSPAADSAANA